MHTSEGSMETLYCVCSHKSMTGKTALNSHQKYVTGTSALYWDALNSKVVVFQLQE